MAYNKHFVAALELMRDVADKKNDDYADDFNPYSNFEGAATLTGQTVEQVLFTLIGVKAERLRQLMAGKEPANEPKRDSVLDLAVYAALWLSWLLRWEERFEPPSLEEAYQQYVHQEEVDYGDYLQLKPEKQAEAERYIEQTWAKGFNPDQGVYLGPQPKTGSGGTKQREES